MRQPLLQLLNGMRGRLNVRYAHILDRVQPWDAVGISPPNLLQQVSTKTRCQVQLPIRQTCAALPAGLLIGLCGRTPSSAS